jgi:siroheme synthase
MTVFLVGAGPGSADLLTVKAHRLISSAQVVVHDRLVSDEIMALIPANAERIDVGRNHQHVVRLKGGDPFVFGRGGEEAEALIKAGVSFEIVPGISSAFSVPAIAGIPVTHRRVARAVTVVTGHCEDPNESVDWSAHAKTGATLVVLMGTANLPKISADLLSAGMKPNTPVAIIHNGTRADQTISRLTLAEAHLAEAQAPSIIVIGETAGLDLRDPNTVHELIASRS